MNKFKIVALILLAFLFLGIIFQKQILTHIKIILFLTEQFPQIPVKPLGLITADPEHKKVKFETSHGKVVADLFVPKSASYNSALIVAMGIKTAEDDKPLILHFADSLARLGYVVFWPRLEVLDQGQSLPEEPETFIKAFEYLEKEPFVNPKRISYMGFSVGSSTALAAVADAQIANRVHSLIFFGGYYNVFDYLLALASKKVDLEEEKISWSPAPDAIDHAKGLLKVKKAPGILQIFEGTTAAQANILLNQAPQEEVDRLKKYSPNEVIDKFKAQIFILHDKSDTYVPYVESIRLDRALSQRSEKVFLIIDLFEHVQPNRPINFAELFKLYGFIYKVFEII